VKTLSAGGTLNGQSTYLFHLDGREEPLEHCAHETKLREMWAIGRLLEVVHDELQSLVSAVSFAGARCDSLEGDCGILQVVLYQYFSCSN
jgi:hypothetical protein